MISFEIGNYLYKRNVGQHLTDMNEPKKHHYIPQSYLRNFAHEIKKKKDGDEYYVHVRFRGEKFHSVNVSNICAETYLYTIPGVDDANKNIIEKYYANNIDNLFSVIYDFVTDDTQKILSSDLRLKLVTACLCLYIRTPSFLEKIGEEYSNLLENLRKYHFGYSEKSIVSFFNRKINLQNLNYDILKADIENKNKAIILREHFQILNEFIDFKLNDGIGIVKLVDDSEFITGDNPLIIRDLSTGDFFDLFDSNNVIHLPINNKYLISLLPHNDISSKNTFNRIESDIIEALVINYDIEKNSKNWIIGNPDSIYKHIEDQEKYNEETPENYQIIEDTVKKTHLVNSMESLLRQKNYKIDKEFIDKVVEISENPLMKNDPNMIRIIENFKTEGRL